MHFDALPKIKAFVPENLCPLYLFLSSLVSSSAAVRVHDYFFERQDSYAFEPFFLSIVIVLTRLRFVFYPSLHLLLSPST